MRWKTIALVAGGLLILSCLPAPAAVKHSSGLRGGGGNCVAYARAVTGIKIDGNAGMWWAHSVGRYDRGQEPKIGSVLVFKSYGHMRSGHVAVVSGVVGPRRILVDHANWVRGRITKAMAVVDTSPNNDWTMVKVLGDRPEAGGQRDNPTFGFIYPRNLPENLLEADTGPHRTSGRAAHALDAHAQAKPHRSHMQLADATPVADAPAQAVKPLHKHRVEPH